MNNKMGLPEQPLHVNSKCWLILRFWRIENSTDSNWRASVEIPEAKKRFGFSSLEQLFAFLIDFTETNCDAQLLDANRKEVQGK